MTTTPNMNLQLPIVSTTEGPDWASLLNSAFAVIDNHDHSDGKGVNVTPAGLNIATDLTFNGNGAISLGYTGFTQSSAPVTNNVVFVDINDSLKWKTSNGEFTILDTNGSSSSSGGFGGDYTSSDALATYSDVTKAYTFLQDTGITAFINSGAISLYENVASSNPITIAPPTSLVSAYTLTLPTTVSPENGRALISSTSGALSYNNQGLQTADTVSFAGLDLNAGSVDEIVLALNSQTTTSTVRQNFYNSDETRNFNLSAFFDSGNEALNIQADNRTFMKFNRDGEIEVSTSNNLTGLLLNGTIGAPAFTVNAGSAVSVFEQKYMRVGATVTFSGALQITTDSLGEVDILIALPVSSNLATSTDLDGATSLRKVSSPGTPILMNSAVFADTANNRMRILIHTASGTTPIQIRYVSTYQVI